MIVTVPASIESVATRKDRTIVLRVGTRSELPPNEMSTLMGLSQKEGVFGFSESSIKSEDFKMADSATPITKMQESPSQKLRKRMYAYWESKQSPSSSTTMGSFQSWYERTLNEIGQRYLDKIND